MHLIWMLLHFSSFKCPGATAEAVNSWSTLPLLCTLKIPAFPPTTNLDMAVSRLCSLMQYKLQEYKKLFVRGENCSINVDYIACVQ